LKGGFCKMRITLSMPGNPQYEDDPTQVTLNVTDGANRTDYWAALPGQWFYGVVHTLTGNIYLVPGNVHDDPQNALQKNGRMLNTYASKPAVPGAGWASLSGAEKYHGIGSTPTGHNAVCRKYGLNPDECVGFRIVKVTNSIATFSDRSNSLNGNKPDQRLVSVVPYGSAAAAAAAGITQVEKNSQGFGPSATARMPPQWAQAVVSYLTGCLAITNFAVDF
jgi:hypothetical protein